MDEYDLAVTGGGPGGYVAAIRAAQLGQRVVLFEKERLGGLCLNWGCIPSKAILRNAEVVNYVRDARDWGIELSEPTFDFGAAVVRSREVVEKIVGGVETLMKQNSITVVDAEASFAGPNTIAAGGQEYAAANTIIATGASTQMLPGVDVDGEIVITSREALARKQVPGRAVVIGGGPVGVEFAYMWSSYGAEVRIIERLETLLPNEDPDIGRALEKSFAKRGIVSNTAASVEGVETGEGAAKVHAATSDGKETIEADTVLVAVGFVPHTEGLGLDRAGVETDERGFIRIDDRLQTNVPDIYAVGDVTGKLMLAHVASHQGVAAVEQMAGLQPPKLDYRQMPRATYCQPQVATIGYTEQEASDAGFAVKAGRFPFAALGHAIAMGDTEGFIKVVADSATGQVLGVHMIGHDVNQILAEASVAMLLEATTKELGFAVAPHPSLSEALKEAALAADDAAIHVARRRRAT